MQVCSDAYDPKKVTPARMPEGPTFTSGPTFTLGSLALDGAMHGQPTTRIAFAEAKNAHELAMGSIRNATSSSQVERLERDAAAKLGAAILKCRDPTELRNLKWRLQQLRKTSSERVSRLTATRQSATDTTYQPHISRTSTAHPRQTEGLLSHRTADRRDNTLHSETVNANYGVESPRDLLSKSDASKLDRIEERLRTNLARIYAQISSEAGSHDRLLKELNDQIRSAARRSLEVIRPTLTRSNLEGVELFTTNFVFAVNGVIREGNPLTNEQEMKCKLIDEAFMRLPVYRGEVHRGVAKPIPREVLEKYIVNDFVREESYTSSSNIERRAFEPASSKSREDAVRVRWIINSRSGRYVGNLSSYSSQEEVAFKRGTVFLVLHKEYVPSLDYWIIVMDEVE